MLTFRVLLSLCVVLVLIILRTSDGRIVYSRIPQYDAYSGSNANNARRGAGSGGGGGGEVGATAAASSGNGGTARYSHGHGHGHGHATSYQNFVLHSYHPVKVYLKPHHHHHDYN